MVVYNKTLGSYAPAFFCMHLESESRLDDLSELSDDDLVVFFHEYTHFLQDIFTVYGIRNILHMFDISRNMYLSIQKNSNEFIDLPFRGFSGINESNIDYSSVYSGDDHSFNFNTLDSWRVSEIPIFNSLKNVEENVRYLEIEVFHSFDPQRKKTTLHFGAIAILESMAYLIESSIKSNTAPTFPYRSVEFLAKKVHPDVDWDNAKLIALCEVSLEAFNPGHKLIDILTRMKDENFIPLCSKDIFDFAICYTIDGESSMDVYYKLLQIVCGDLLYFFSGESLLSVRKWLEAMIIKCIEYKNKGFSFAGLVEGKNSKDIIELFYDLMANIGVPLMSNSKNLYWNDAKAHGAQIVFKAIFESYLLMQDVERTHCELKGFCDSTGSNITCSLCDTGPWERINQGKACTLTSLWRLWGIDQKKFKKE